MQVGVMQLIETYHDKSTIAKDGNRIYFTSADIDGGKGSDIWYIEPKDDNMWKYPVNAGAEINTDANEDYAFVE